MKNAYIARVALFAGIVAMLAAVSACSQSRAAKPDTELLVAAAASLKDSLDELEPLYEKAHPEVDLVFNYASSGTLQKQLEQGAPADLFFSAGEKQMDALVQKDLIGDHTVMLKNELVVVVPADSGRTLTSLEQLSDSDVTHIAVGQPESVPAGQYAQDTLVSRGLWDQLQTKIVFAKDVRQVLSYVETGNADAGFVYKTDALTSDKVRQALPVEPGDHEPIVYPAGVVRASEHAEEAEAFYAYLQSSEAARIFESYGFLLP